MKKNILRNTSVIALFLALSAAFILAGCINPIEPSSVPGAGALSLSVSIAGPGGGARTLYPDTTFTKYDLIFRGESGKSYDPKTITGVSTAVYDDIPPGVWTITAIGYVTINGTDYAAAEGSSDPVVITAGSKKSVNIDIRAEQSRAAIPDTFTIT
jgi:hypothetical protein